MDSDLLAGSLVNSQSKYEVEFYSDPGSATNSSFVADSDSATGSDSKTEERSRPAILRLVVGSYRQYDQLQCSMYMNTAKCGKSLW